MKELLRDIATFLHEIFMHVIDFVLGPNTVTEFKTIKLDFFEGRPTIGTGESGIPVYDLIFYIAYIALAIIVINYLIKFTKLIFRKLFGGIIR